MDSIKTLTSAKDVYKLIHGKDAEGKASYAGTIYDLIMKLLGKLYSK